MCSLSFTNYVIGGERAVPVDFTSRGHDAAAARGVGPEAEGQKALLALLKLRLGYVRRALNRLKPVKGLFTEILFITHE